MTFFFEVLIPDMIVQGVRSSTIQYVKWQTSGVVFCYFCMYAVCEHEEVEQGGVWKSSRDGDRATGEISINYTLKWSLIIDDIPVRPAISFEMRSSVHSGAAQGSAGMVYVCVCVCVWKRETESSGSNSLSSCDSFLMRTLITLNGPLWFSLPPTRGKVK